MSLHDRDLPLLTGVIRTGSADSRREETSGVSFFTAELVVPESQMALMRSLRGADIGIRPACRDGSR